MRMLLRLSLIILVIVLRFHPKIGKSNPNNSAFGFFFNLGGLIVLKLPLILLLSDE